MRIVDPTLPRDGTDLMTLRIACVSLTRRYRVTVLTSSASLREGGIVDPTLPRDATDLILRRCVRR
jgi:hypothetical protein